MTESNWANALRSNQPIAAAISAAKADQPKSAEGTFVLPSLTVGRGYRYGNLTWFPIFTDAPATQRQYATSAVAQGKVSVVEATTPTVGHLQVQNQLELPVLLFEGALLEGGWQHRAITRTVWVEANSQTQIPVVCVEAGRWNGATLQSLGNKTAPARVRAAMRGMHRDHTGMAHQGQADQSQVWNEVRNFAQATAKHRPTESLVEMAQQLEKDIAYLRLNAPQPIFGQRGVMVAMAGRPLALEVFDHQDTLAERLPSILDAFLPESLTQPYQQCTSSMARTFVARVEKVGVMPTGETGRFRNDSDKYVASEAVTTTAGEFLHLATLNAQHQVVLAA